MSGSYRRLNKIKKPKLVNVLDNPLRQNWDEK